MNPAESVRLRACAVVDAQGYVAWIMPEYTGPWTVGQQVGTHHPRAARIEVKPCPIMGGPARTYYAVSE